VLDPIGFGLFDFLRAYLGLAGAAQIDDVRHAFDRLSGFTFLAQRAKDEVHFCESP
jgi:hypothetical protein